MPPNFRVIRVMCSGRIDPLFVLKSLESGADGVLVMGCHPGDCHYIGGNYKAERRMKFLKHILSELGIGERVELHWVAASEGPEFQHVITDFTSKITELGPSPLNSKYHFRKPVKEDQKRDQLQDLLVSLADQLGYHPSGPVEVPEDDVMEGYGFPVIDGDKCIGCGACFLNCPEQVILMEDHEGERSISHYQFNCRTCRRCEEICPQEAVKIKTGFELGAFLSGEAINDIDLKLRECRICGNRFSTAAQLDFVRKRLEENNMEVELEGISLKDAFFNICPECRREIMAVRMKNQANMETIDGTRMMEVKHDKEGVPGTQ
jgi:coenzyme F420-reducing hydrogenase delta subunit/formate hydrogenlyase subunit 6/NADH:ubiquinone oxidoreductase subunit I